FEYGDSECPQDNKGRAVRPAFINALEKRYHMPVIPQSVRSAAHWKLWQVGSDDFAEEGVAGGIWGEAIAAVVGGVSRKSVGHKWSPGVNDVSCGIVGDDPVSQGRQINAVPGRLKSVLHGDTVGLELNDQV